MRILHVNHKASFQGGVERVVYDTARSLSARGWPQALLCEESTPDVDFSLVFDDVDNDWGLLERFMPDLVLIHKCEDPALIDRLTAAFVTVRMVHDHDIVCMRRHKYFPLSTKVCNKPAGIACYRHLCFVQKTPPGSKLPIQLKPVSSQMKVIRANRKIDAFIVGSRFMRNELLINGFNADVVNIIHPIPSSLDSVSLQARSESREILFVGQLIRGKGVDLMIRALAGLKDEWHATIIGDGSHLDACKGLAQELGLGSKVDFRGWVDHEALNTFYENARFTVVPSRWPEPFGMVGIEAMARGRAVVGFDVGGIPDWLDDQHTGLLVPEADTRAMAEAMQKLLDEPGLAAGLGEAAYQRVNDHFRHDIYIEQMMTLLEKTV